MLAAVLIIGLALVVPFCAGFASRFLDTRAARRWVQGSAFVPITALVGWVSIMGASEVGVAALAFLGASLGISALFVVIGRAFGRPFAEIRDERRRERTRRVFD